MILVVISVSTQYFWEKCMSVCLLKEWFELKTPQTSSTLRYLFFLTCWPNGFLSSIETTGSVYAVSDVVLHSTEWCGLYVTSKIFCNSKP